MRKGLYFCVAVAGALAGAAAAWNYAKKKYDRIAQEEIDSVKDVFSRRMQDESREMAERAREKAAVEEYAAVLQKSGYADVSSQEECPQGSRGPYVITPDEYGEHEEYDQICFTYYADGILADDSDEVIEDVKSLVGDALEHFGEYEEDSVLVRCDEKRCDYEILLDKRNFEEVTGRSPHRLEAE